MFYTGTPQSYPFPSTSINLIDETYFKAEEVEETPVNFNILIAGKFDKGPTNKLIQFYQGQHMQFIKRFGKPNYTKYGIGPDIAYEALNQVEGGIGVLAINLRGAGAKHANVILAAKVKILTDQPKLNEQNEPLYLTPEGVESTVAAGNEAIVRDVLTAKFVKLTGTSVTDRAAFESAVDATFSDTADTDGFKTIPLIGMMYDGASNYGNNIYARLLDTVSEYDGSSVYRIELFDGEQLQTPSETMSMFQDAAFRGESMYIENVLNGIFEDLTVVTSSHAYKFYDLLNTYVKSSDPKLLNIFKASNYEYVTDAASIDLTASKALVLENGSDGTDTLDAMLQSFYSGTIVNDLRSIIRYKINYIPDLEYSSDVKDKIEAFLDLRCRTTIFRSMLGSTTIESGIADARDYHNCVSNISKGQSPIGFNEFTKRNHRIPASYYDTLSLIELIVLNKNPYTAFAGADVRWKGFNEDTMLYPKEDPALLKQLSNARINVVKKDGSAGAYLFEQNMYTERVSDQTEFNNAMMIADMIYDVAQLIHKNNYKFNDYDDVAKFKENVNLQINPKYKPYQSALTVDVYKAGTSGAAKNTNKIRIKVNFKDLAKTTEVELILTDEL